MVCMHALLLSDSLDCSPQGSSVHGVSQAGILEWVATPAGLPGGDPLLQGIFPIQGLSLPLLCLLQ